MFNISHSNSIIITLESPDGYLDGFCSPNTISLSTDFFSHQTGSGVGTDGAKVRISKFSLCKRVYSPSLFCGTQKSVLV